MDKAIYTKSFDVKISKKRLKYLSKALYCYFQRD